MPPKRGSRLRWLIAALGIISGTLAGAGGEGHRSEARPFDRAAHGMPRGDTPHDSFAAADVRPRVPFTV